MGTIICKELKELVRDGRFKIAMFMVIVLVLLAAITGLRQYQNSNEQLQASVAKERNIWDTQAEKNPHSAAHYGTYAFKPKFALSVFDYGVNQYTGNSVFLEAHNRNDAAYSEASDQTSLARFGTLSMSFILLYLCPLLIILMGYNSLSKERENNTLTLLKSQGIRPLTLALGKWMAILIPIVGLTTLVFFGLGLVLANSQDMMFFSWTNLIVMYLLYVAYYMIIAALTLICSIWCTSSGIALVCSLMLWIVFSFITPKVATNRANARHPYPSKLVFNNRIAADKKNGLDGHNPWNEAAKTLEEKTLKAYGVDSLSQLPFNYSGYRMQKGEEHEAQIYNKHYNALEATALNQNTTYQNLSFISPFIPLRFLSMDVAHTSGNLHLKFTKAAEAYRLQKQAFLNNDIKDNATYGVGGYTMNQAQFKQLPVFRFTPPTLAQIRSENTKNLWSLSLWLLLSFLSLIVIAIKKI